LINSHALLGAALLPQLPRQVPSCDFNLTDTVANSSRVHF
jgi:hypothetical protein